MAIKLGGLSGGGSGDSSWDSVLLLVPFDSDSADVKSSIAPTVSGSAISVAASGKYGSYGANTAGNTSSYATGAFGGGDWTVEFWLNRESFFDTNAKILDLGAVEIEASGADDINFYFSTSDTNFGTTSNSVTQGQWFHIAVVYDSGVLRSYINGVQLGSLTESVTDPTSVVLGNTAGFDDLRVTASARYPGGTTFTPPTAAHATGSGSSGDVSAIYLGSTEVTAAYLGATEVYSPSAAVAGSLYSWGSRYGTGQLGTDSDWTSLGGGENWSFAIKSSGLLHAWGENSQGNLGDGTTTARAFSVQIGSDQWSMLARGGLYHSLGIKFNGTLWAWGNGGNGRLGLGSTTSYNTPQQVGSATWEFVAAGENCSYAIKSDGTLHSWGFGVYGQLGLGSTSSPTTPQQVGSATWSAIAGGENFSAAIKSDGTLWTVGYSSDGQLGDGSSSNRTTFSQVGSASWLSVTCGRYHGLAIRSDGTLWAWGNNAGGQLGLGNFTNQNTLQQVGSATWSRIHSFGFDTIGVRSDGTLWHWGNSSGQSSPVQVGSSTGYFEAQVGSSYEIALRS